MDRLIDIMNGRKSSKIEDRYNMFINEPNHHHISIGKIFDVLCIFVEWQGKYKGKGNIIKFITYKTYDDLRYMVFGISTRVSLSE